MGEYGWWWRWWSKWWSGWWWCCMVNCDEWWVIQPQHHSPQFIAVAPMNPGFHSRAYIRRTSTTRLERDCGKFGNNRRQRRFGSVVVGPIFLVFPCQQQNHYWHTACLKGIQKVDHMCVLFCNFGETTRPYGFLSQIIQSETLISIIWFWCVMASKAFKPCMFRCSHTILSVWGGLIRSEGDVQEAIPILFTRLFLRFNFHDHDNPMYLLLFTCIIL